jgi:hypothetical protein
MHVFKDMNVNPGLLFYSSFGQELAEFDKELTLVSPGVFQDNTTQEMLIDYPTIFDKFVWTRNAKLSFPEIYSIFSAFNTGDNSNLPPSEWISKFKSSPEFAKVELASRDMTTKGKVILKLPVYTEEEEEALKKQGRAPIHLQVALYTPGTYEPGSSLSHYDLVEGRGMEFIMVPNCPQGQSLKNRMKWSGSPFGSLTLLLLHRMGFKLTSAAKEFC